MAKYHCTQHGVDFFKTPAMRGYAHPIVDEHGEDVIDAQTGKQAWCNKPKQDMSAMEGSAEHLVKAVVKEGGEIVGVTDKPTKDIAIARAVALKAAVELTCSGVIDRKDIGAYSRKFEEYLATGK